MLLKELCITIVSNEVFAFDIFDSMLSDKRSLINFNINLDSSAVNISNSKKVEFQITTVLN